jgi:hypothetical protein
MLIDVGSPGRIGHVRPVVLIEAYGVVKRYTGRTSKFGKIRINGITRLRLLRETPF